MVQLLNTINDLVWGTPFIVFVFLVGVYYMLRGGFFTFTHFGHIMKNTLGSLTSKEANTKKEGTVSPFEAVCVAIGGCVGCANISGVATAIATGGPGAVFWMWLWALFAMMVKLAEVALGCYYRGKDENGNYYGGSMYYIEKGIGREMGMKKTAGVLAFLFCLCFVLQSIQGSQAFTIAEILHNSFGFNMIAVTVAYSLFVMYVIWAGTPRICAFASKLVPIMCVVYLLGGIVLIVVNIGNLPAALASIFHDAFTGRAAFGGFLGATVAKAISSGVSRSMNSNEAGMGSSPLVHGSADTVHPVRQGLWGAFEVFIDTLVVCSVTALAVLCSGVWDSGATGATLSMMAFETAFGRFSSVFIGIMALMFGFTTTAGWYVYYANTIAYILRRKPILRDRLITAFKIYFPLMNIVIVCWVVLTGNDANLFWTLVSLVTALPVAVNLVAMLFLGKKFSSIFADYKARYLGKGQVDPNFHVFYEDDPEIARQEEAIREELRKVSSAHKK